MPSNYTIPGVYVEEIPRFPPSVAQVETAIPAFMGYTEFRLDRNGNPLDPAVPVRIASLTEFETLFGGAPPLTVTQIRLDADNNFLGADIETSHYLYHALQLFYANGGGDCYIVSVGTGFDAFNITHFQDAIAALESVDEPTILCFPDAAADETANGGGNLYSLQQDALGQCALLGDRITLCDLELPGNDVTVPTTNFRNAIGINNLKYGAAYTPWLRAVLPKNVSYVELQSVPIVKTGVTNQLQLTPVNAPDTLSTDTGINAILTQYDTDITNGEPAETLALREEALIAAFGAYKAILAGLNTVSLDIPPSGAVAGIMATVDRTRGVWKAPANVSVNSILGPTHTYNQGQLSGLNVDTVAGKSINAIRTFTGKGTLVWGARTLAGNDNEWRYVSVRRFYNMVEESVKKATEQFVFEPNDANTWVRVQAMIENFLTLQWRQGALQGASQEQAFRVAVGLGKTMTAQDVLEGRMIVEIAMAPVRPAEFIILRFEQKMPEA